MNNTQAAAHPPHSLGIFHFVSELRRRRVCRAAVVYSVAMWLIYQVVELVAPELGLPQWTLRFVILIGLLGFPIAMILSWLFEITPDGLVVDSDKRRPGRTQSEQAPDSWLDRLIDGVLVIAALIVGIQLAIGSVDSAAASSGPDMQKIVVLPFRVAAQDSTPWSEILVIELQHELRSRTDMTVIAPKDPFQVDSSVRLTGAIAHGPNYLQITATLVDNDSGVVAWSYKFEWPVNDTPIAPAEIARKIVSLLPGSSRLAASTGEAHEIKGRANTTTT